MIAANVAELDAHEGPMHLVFAGPDRIYVIADTAVWAATTFERQEA